MENTDNIDSQTLEMVRGIAEEEGRSIAAVMRDAAELYRRKIDEPREIERFWIDAHASYARLQADPAVWKEYLNDLQEPYYTEEEERQMGDAGPK